MHSQLARLPSYFKYLTSLIIALASLWFFILPGITASWYIATDKGLNSSADSAFLWNRHPAISKQYAKYCRERIDSEVAASLTVDQLEATEWPLFGSVFYLWATENMQSSWEKNPSLSNQAPAIYAREAIDAAKDLVLDPNHAKWVIDHYGKDQYLEHDNVFYRMLCMQAIISHHNLTGETKHLPFLRDQVSKFTAELEASPHGLLDDYPHQCYPTDVLAAIDAIKRADPILGSDHSEFIKRAQRGFTGKLAAPNGLPAYSANKNTGYRLDDSRGCSNSYMTTAAFTLWPTKAAQWYQTYRKDYWQAGWFASGFREFPHDQGYDYYHDIDSGPVLHGLGTAATAFGMGAARANGDYGTAGSLAYQMIAASWPLPNGQLKFPQLFSKPEHSRHLGEVGILYQLSHTPPANMNYNQTSKTSWSVYAMLAGYFILGVPLLYISWRLIRKK